MPVSLLVIVGLSVCLLSCPVGAIFSVFVSRTVDEEAAILANEARAKLSFPADAATYNQSLLGEHLDMRVSPESTGNKSPSGLRNV